MSYPAGRSKRGASKGGKIGFGTQHARKTFKSLPVTGYIGEDGDGDGATFRYKSKTTYISDISPMRRTFDFSSFLCEGNRCGCSDTSAFFLRSLAGFCLLPRRENYLWHLSSLFLPLLFPPGRIALHFLNCKRERGTDIYVLSL